MKLLISIFRKVLPPSLLFCVVNSAFAFSFTQQPSDIEQNIDQILTHFPAYHIGILVKSLDNGAILYQRNAQKNFTPASSLKLFTGAAALDYLGPDYKFSTQFLVSHAQRDKLHKIIKGNLYVKFSGDPYLTRENLRSMVAFLAHQHIYQIQGNIIIDDTALERSGSVEGRVADDKIFPYAAPVTATIINRNCFNLCVIPIHRPHKKTYVKIISNPGVVIENQITTHYSRKKFSMVDLKAAQSLEQKNHYILSGYLSSQVGPLSFAVALQNPNLATSMILNDLFRNYKIKYKSILYGKTPKNADVLTEITSPPLAFLLKNMLKKSDNLIADTLFKKLGEMYFHVPGSWKTGSMALERILGSEADIDFTHLHIVDGSGLSLANAVSPNNFVKLLTFVYSDLPNNSLFFAALPLSGVDGTLKYRLNGFMQGRVHAKTGSMKGVSSLVGYVRNTNNQMLAFAILINDPRPNQSNQYAYRLLENRVCEILAHSH